MPRCHLTPDAHRAFDLVWPSGTAPATPANAAVLDTYFKSYFWTFRLFVLAVIAFIVAQTANAFIAQSLAVPAAELAAPKAATGAAKRRPARNLSAAWAPFLERNVFKAKREDLKPPPPVDGPKEGVDADPLDPSQYTEENCEPSAMATNLVTTMVTPNPEESVAVFQDSGAKDIIVYRVGDKIQDQATVMKIERRNVYVNNSNQCERFALGEGKKKAPRVAARPRRNGRDKGPELGKGVKKVNDNEYTIPKAEIDNVLSNLNKIATQARIVPSFRNGKANGFKLFSIRPNSLYAKIGIQNGDIIQKINGYEINSPDKALAIYSKLKDATNISVDLLRRGKKKSLSYNIR